MTEEKVKKAYATYRGEVSMVDTWFGNLLRQVERMGLIDNTAIIFTTDHGTYFNEHDQRYGKIAFVGQGDPTAGKMPGLGRTPHYEEVIAIPLFIYMPGIEPGVYSGLTSAIDLMPTVLEMFGQDIPSTVEGKSLVPKLKDKNLPGYDHVFTSFSFMNKGDTNVCADGPLRTAEYDSLATVTTEEWSLIYDTNPGMSELYNLKTDPGQNKNVISEKIETAKHLHDLFVQHMRDTKVDERFITPRLELRL
jgi:arylsulfatase A-like enzyme